MTGSETVFLTNASTEADIIHHLHKVNYDFTPPLSSYVNIEEYARKLYLRADRYELWVSSMVAGLLAGYVQDHIFFISNFSVIKELAGKGWATYLFDQLKRDLGIKEISYIQLEVFNSNERAVGFYKKLGFVIVGDKGAQKSLLEQRVT